MLKKWREKHKRLQQEKERLERIKTEYDCREPANLKEMVSIADELGFPDDREVNREFYHHLFKLLKDQRDRIEELERKIK